MTTGHNPPILRTNLNRIAHYRILRTLGQGGMSVVYECMDEKLKRPVAVKVLHPFLAASLEYRARFFREAEAVARLTHPNIVQIFDVASIDANHEQLYIVTELLLGDTLRDFVKRLNIIELPELSAMIIWQVAHALDHAHQKGIIHRDIKPENIMICRDGQIKLMDFGIASVGSEESLTQSGTLLGSLCHLSPEVIKGQKATASSDIFSLTTVFYWMLTKQLPFTSDSPHALLKAIVDTPHQPVQYLSPFISDNLAEVVDIGMKKDPKDRFKNVAIMADAIETSLAKMGITIDIKQMQTTLKDPEGKFAHFTATIDSQLKKHLLSLGPDKNNPEALAIACRLDATTSTIHSATPAAKPKTNKRVLFAIVSIAILVAAFLALRTESPVIAINSDPPPLVASPIDAKINGVLEELNLVDEKKINSPEPKPEIKEKLTDETAKPEARVQEVEIVVWPFANIIVDGKLVAKDTKSLKLRLSQGMHRLTFTHRYAASVDKIIKVTTITDPLELKISLIKSKPAFLHIFANVDADVAIDGSYKGSTKKSLSHPIVVPIPDKTHSQTKEVIVSHEGFKPFIIETEFIAGQTKEIDVKLVPLGKARAE